MENYLTPSNWTNTYAPAALQGIFVAIPSIPPFLFLLYVQLLKKEIFLTYKYTVFMTCYLCFINQSLKLFAYIGQYYAAIVQMQGLSLNRFLNIIFHIQPKVYWFLVIGLGVYLVQVAYLIISLIDAQLVYGNACNPMLGTNILDGAMFPLTWMFGYNTVTGILNLWLIIHLRLHYRKLKGKSVSLEQQKIQRNIQIGLLVSSIYPALQQAYTAVQVKMAYSREFFEIGPITVINYWTNYSNP
ncbi:unnamed protein product, partial [Mesorhabditis belari]|uniref:Uncharacterized protein n=1 Tax=Mesorhabditis belari TaxID=2138241 RepID=A0AAF3EG97_9BILA